MLEKINHNRVGGQDATEEHHFVTVKQATNRQGENKNFESFLSIERVVDGKLYTSFQIVGTGDLNGIIQGERSVGESVILTFENGAVLKHLASGQPQGSYPLYFVDGSDLTVEAEFLPLQFVLFNISGVGLVWLCLETALGADYKASELFAEPCGFPCDLLTKTKALVGWETGELAGLSVRNDAAGEAPATIVNDSHVVIQSGKAFNVDLIDDLGNTVFYVALCEGSDEIEERHCNVSGRVFMWEDLQGLTISWQDVFSPLSDNGFQVVEINGNLVSVARKNDGSFIN